MIRETAWKVVYTSGCIWSDVLDVINLEIQSIFPSWRQTVCALTTAVDDNADSNQ